jgi:hypothetical protein
MALYAFDGTWNKPDSKEDDFDKNTNVYNFLKFYAPDDPETLGKLEEYKEGVGTRLGAGGRIVGGFFGAGGRDRVREMVASFAENWAHNGPEDRTVDVIGFSRGAALALHFCNKLAKGVEVEGEAEKIKPKIRFLGLWDVVPSFGLPGIVIPQATDINIGWDLDVPDCVENCFHAMALDERRGAFSVHRLDPENDDAPRIQEWWFRGVHSDVGGGNGNVLLGNISLKWMLQQGQAIGAPIAVDEIAGLKSDDNAKVSPSDKQGRWQDRTVQKGDRFHPSVARKLSAGESATIEVDSKLRFDFSGLLIEEGEKYTFAPDPAGKWKDKSIDCDASGWPPNLNRGRTLFGWFKEKALESHAVGLTRRVPDANWFEMVACVGVSGKPAIAIGHGQFAQNPWRATASGLLFFFANDARMSGFGHDFYENNAGAINVKVTRVA